MDGNAIGDFIHTPNKGQNKNIFKQNASKWNQHSNSKISIYALEWAVILEIISHAHYMKLPQIDIHIKIIAIFLQYLERKGPILSAV